MAAQSPGWLAHRNTDDHTAHDVTELEVFARSIFMVVVALNAGRGDGFVRVDRNGIKIVPTCCLLMSCVPFGVIAELRV